jgi:hypothetical protein
VLAAEGDLQRVLGELRLLRHHARRRLDGAAELDDPLRQQVGVVAACSYTWSNSWCSAMNAGPLTFQWACLACVTRSTASDRRSCRSPATWTRTFSEMSFFVLCIGIVLSSGAHAGFPRME